MKKAIAYYRVSTRIQVKDQPHYDSKKNEITDLDLEAQQKVLQQFANCEGYIVIGEHQEVECGRKNGRPHLLAALAQCRNERATLIIAKFDSLGRNTAFISKLMESKVDFRVVDKPHVNRLMMHLLIDLANHEREQYQDEDA